MKKLMNTTTRLTPTEKEYLSLLINSQDEHIYKIAFHKEKLKSINESIDKILPNKTKSKKIKKRYNKVYNISNNKSVTIDTVLKDNQVASVKMENINYKTKQ